MEYSSSTVPVFFHNHWEDFFIVKYLERNSSGQNRAILLIRIYFIT